MKDIFIDSGAKFSSWPNLKYRYALWRIWNKEKPKVLFIMLNPSTADELDNDPTIRRCINFAKSWGYGGIYVANLFPYRTKNPKEILDIFNPEGFDNDIYIKRLAKKSKIIIAAWGINGKYHNADFRMFQKIKSLKGTIYHLGLTKSGQPKHPLYLPKDTKPIKWE